jgi:hypothetical protein
VASARDADRAVLGDRTALAMSPVTSAYLPGVLQFGFPAPHLVMSFGPGPLFNVWF